MPHYQPLGATFFVTFRLAGSLPNEVVGRLRDEEGQAEEAIRKIKDPEERREKLLAQQKRYFARFDRVLDTTKTGPFWLRQPRIAKLVADAIHYRDGRDYDLLAYCIMPNHVHMVIQVARDSPRTERAEARSTTLQYPLTDILRSLKGSTAREANKILERSGAFWQHESYDHVVRNDKELIRTNAYVLNNPVAARMAGSLENWKWSYVKDGIEV